MGEAARRRSAAFSIGPWPGGDKRCPQCFGAKVAIMPTDTLEMEFYGRTLAICADCGIAWEPIDEASIWDRSDPYCSTKEPCDNCAFRAGSPELADKGKWKNMLASLDAGASFYCHKGVPIAPGSEDGFAYPKDKPHHLRLCRGYLNTLGKWGTRIERAKRRDDEAAP